MQVVSGAKVVGLESVQTNSDATVGKRFTVTYQTSKGLAGAGGAVLKSKRSSLYEGLESLSSAEEDENIENEVGGIDGLSGRTVAPRTEKATHTIDCDRVIVATGSSRLGYNMVRAQGHSMHDPLPSLFSFKIHVSDLAHYHRL